MARRLRAKLENYYVKIKRYTVQTRRRIPNSERERGGPGRFGNGGTSSPS